MESMRAGSGQSVHGKRVDAIFVEECMRTTTDSSCLVVCVLEDVARMVNIFPDLRDA